MSENVKSTDPDDDELVDLYCAACDDVFYETRRTMRMVGYENRYGQLCNACLKDVYVHERKPTTLSPMREVRS